MPLGSQFVKIKQLEQALRELEGIYKQLNPLDYDYESSPNIFELGVIQKYVNLIKRGILTEQDVQKSLSHIYNTIFPPGECSSIGRYSIQTLEGACEWIAMSILNRMRLKGELPTAKQLKQMKIALEGIPPPKWPAELRFDNP